jgi:flagellar biosynthesis protein FlhB
MEISSFMKKKQKKQVAIGLIILIIAVSSSLLLKAVFLSNELAIGFSLANFYPYHTRIFGILSAVEILKAILYFVGGLVVGVYREKRVKPDKAFAISNTPQN